MGISKRLNRREQDHTLLIGEAVRVFVASLSRDDMECPNRIELVIGGSDAPPITIRLSNLNSTKPMITIEAPQDLRISHESRDPLPDTN